MALSTGAKIAIGCGAAVVLTGVGAIVLLVGATWWGAHEAKKAFQGIEAQQKGTEAALEKANANAFTLPDDGLVQEDRLVRFLAVRKAIHDNVYLKHKDMIEAQAKKKEPDLSALAKLPFIISELRAAKAEALASQQMSESEFNWLFRTVYGNLIAASASRDGGPGAGEAVRASSQAAVEQAEKAAAAAEANPNLAPETKRQIREAAERARQGAARAEEASYSLDVPPANLALFKKHHEEILEYTMGGLELIPF
ncbi:MAG TPA: hypothetical protein VF310_10680 [Vicinamibacteria bacterium]